MMYLHICKSYVSAFNRNNVQFTCLEKKHYVPTYSNSHLQKLAKFIERKKQCTEGGGGLFTDSWPTGYAQLNSLVSLTAKFTLPDQVELIKYKTLSPKHYDPMFVICLNYPACKSHVCAAILCLDHLWPLWPQYFYCN